MWFTFSVLWVGHRKNALVLVVGCCNGRIRYVVILFTSAALESFIRLII